MPRGSLTRWSYLRYCRGALQAGGLICTISPGLFNPVVLSVLLTPGLFNQMVLNVVPISYFGLPQGSSTRWSCLASMV
jgi:hypothetical protein